MKIKMPHQQSKSLNFFQVELPSLVCESFGPDPRSSTKNTCEELWCQVKPLQDGQQ